MDLETTTSLNYYSAIFKGLYGSKGGHGNTVNHILDPTVDADRVTENTIFRI